MTKRYDYLIVGAGLFGSTFAHFAHKQGKMCLVIDRRKHLGGNVYCEGKLQYRTVRFETAIEDSSNYQGNAVVNYTEREVPFTRIIEHKHFEMFGQEVYDCPKTVISKEYSTEWKPGMEPYYPVNDAANAELYAKYKAMADNIPNLIIGGRLAEYKYYDMASTVENVMKIFK